MTVANARAVAESLGGEGGADVPPGPWPDGAEVPVTGVPASRGSPRRG